MQIHLIGRNEYKVHAVGHCGRCAIEGEELPMQEKEEEEEEQGHGYSLLKVLLQLQYSALLQISRNSRKFTRISAEIWFIKAGFQGGPPKQRNSSCNTGIISLAVQKKV
jgi:hypothetical protein